MDKKRSSLKRSSSTTEYSEGAILFAAGRQKRRISFSGKKSVREFCAEEKPKSWDNSYELSDPVNVSDGDPSGKEAVLADPKIDWSASLAVPGNATDLKNKSDFIPDNALCCNKMQLHSNINTTLLYEEQGRNGSGVLLKSYEDKHACMTFSLSETEINSTNTANRDRKLDLENTLICYENMQESTFMEDETPNSIGKKRVTLYPNEPISVDNERKGGSNLTRLTMLQTSDMDLSLECKSEKIDDNIKKNNTKYITIKDIDQINISNCDENSIPLDAIEMAENVTEKLRVISLRTEDTDKRYLKTKDINKGMCIGWANINGEIVNNEHTAKLSNKKRNNTPNKDKSSKVKVVRKTCGLFKGTCKIESKPDKRKNECSINFNTEFCRPDDKNVLNLSNKVSMTEFGSPLFPEFLLPKAKKLNFRQLNDGIVHGNIVVFPKNEKNETETETVLANTLEVSSNSSTHFSEDNTISKQRQAARKSTTLVSKEDVEFLNNVNMDIEEITDDNKNSDSRKIDIGLNFQTSRKSEVEATNTEDVLLENTSFLVRAKFDDESTSRHKCVVDDKTNSSNFDLTNCANLTFGNDLEDIHEKEYVETMDISNGRNVIVTNKNACTDAQVEILDIPKKKSTYEIQDMSLNDSIIGTLKSNFEENKGYMHLELSSLIGVHNAEHNIAASPNEELSTLKEYDEISGAQRAIDEDQSLCIYTTVKKQQKTAFTQSVATENVEASDDVLQTNFRRRTEIFTNNDISLDDSLVTSKVIDKHSKFKDNEHETSYKQCKQSDLQSKVQQMSLTKLLNPARFSLSRQYATEADPVQNDSMILKLNEARAATFSNSKRKTVYFEQNNDISPEVSPVVNIEKPCMIKPFDGTPHRSVLEFEWLEREAEKDQERHEEEERRNKKGIAYDQHMEENREVTSNNKGKSVINSRRQTTYEDNDLEISGVKPLQNDNCNSLMEISPIGNVSNKRLTSNLTPNLPLSKRQTLLFSKFDIEESFLVTTNKSKEKNCIEPLDCTITPGCEVTIEQDISGLNASDNYNNNKIAKESDIEMETTLHQEKENTKCINNNKPSDIELPSNNEIENLSNTSEACVSDFMAEANKSQSVSLQYVTIGKLNNTDLNFLSDTIEAPRKATTIQRDKSIHFLLEDNAEISKIITEPEKQQSIVAAFEDNPITISDVSAHYLAHRNTLAVQEEEKGLERGSLIDLCANSTINKRIANFKKDYENLTRGNSSASVSDQEDIDKTRLSLVESLLCDDDEDEDEESGENITYDKVGETSKQAANTNATMRSESIIRCNRCKRCQETLQFDGTLTTDESFKLPPIAKFPDLGLEQLERLRQRPRIADVHEYWRRRSLEKSFSISNLSASSDQLASVSRELIREEPIIISKELEKIEAEISELSKLNMVQATNQFVHCLDKLLSEHCLNWVFDYQLQAINRFMFHHKKIITFNIVIVYECKDILRNSLEIKSIKKQSSRTPKKNWKPIDFVMDFQLQIELPFDLMSICNSSTENGVFEFLKTIDEICQRVLAMGCVLWKLVCRENALLGRENGQTFVQKIVREIVECEDSYTRVEKKLFRIELKNINTLSFKDIVFPPLYSFREDIQYLPNGVNFLHSFLTNPTDYLKSDVNS